MGDLLTVYPNKMLNLVLDIINNLQWLVITNNPPQSAWKLKTKHFFRAVTAIKQNVELVQEMG